jgi:hydrogenase maturation protease
MDSDVLVIGVGNDFRGDDAIGLAVARALRATPYPGVTVREQSGDGAALMEAWSAARAVIVVDAVEARAAPGTIFRFDARLKPLTARFQSASTHVFGLAEAVELARALGQLPPELIVYAIQGHDYTPGAPLSPVVRQAQQRVITRVSRDIHALSAPAGSPQA